MNYNHIDKVSCVEFSRSPDFSYQGDQQTKRSINQTRGELLIDIEFIITSVCHKIVYVGNAPVYIPYLCRLFPRVEFHIYDDQICDKAVIYNRPFDLQDVQEWQSIKTDEIIAFNFYHSKSPEIINWCKQIKPNAALFRYGPGIFDGEILRVPFGDSKINDGLAVVVFEYNKLIKYQKYIPPSHTCVIDDVDIYASSNVARVMADNCYECYAARDIILRYLLFMNHNNNADTRYDMLHEIFNMIF